MMPEIHQQTPGDQIDSLPFPHSKRPYCPYEPVEKSIKKIRVLIVNDLLRDESNLSDTARREWGGTASARLERERYISGLALDNIVTNIQRLVEEPEIRVAHLSLVYAVPGAGRRTYLSAGGRLPELSGQYPRGPGSTIDDFRAQHELNVLAPPVRRRGIQRGREIGRFGDELACRERAKRLDTGH